jgi:hypothetical protein
VSGNGTFKSAVSVSGNIDTAGNVSVGGALLATGAGTFASTVTVSGAGTFKSGVSITGNIQASGNVSIGGNVTVKGDVHVSSKVCASAFYGDGSNITGVPITGNISVSNVTVGGNLYVSGTATVVGNVVFSGGTFALAKSAAVSVHATAIDGVTSVSLNFGSAQNFRTTVTAAHTLARPTNARVGQVGSIFFVQSGGAGAISYNACWKFPAASAPTFATSAGAVSRLDYIVVSISTDNTGENIHAIMTQEYA